MLRALTLMGSHTTELTTVSSPMVTGTPSTSDGRTMTWNRRPLWLDVSWLTRTFKVPRPVLLM